MTGGNHHSSYGPANLFNGVTTAGTQAQAQANRWLATQYKGGAAGWAQIEVPQECLPNACPGLVVKRYRLWHYSPLSDAYFAERMPATWTLYGSNDGTTWKAIHEQTQNACWRNPATGYIDYFECTVPQTVGYRFFKFQPSSSYLDAFPRDDEATLTWRYALMELEIFAEEAPLNLRDAISNAGATLADCVSGTGEHPSYGVANLFDGKGMDGKEDLPTRWLGGEKSVADATAVFSIPEEAIGENNVGFEPVRFRIWRNIATYGLHRAPTTWKIEGSNDKTEWVEIQDTSESRYE